MHPCTTVLTALLTFVLTSPFAVAQSKLFPPPLTIETEGGENFKESDHHDAFAYLSPTVGAFIIQGRDGGHASFRYNHDLDVDWHRHDLKYHGKRVHDGETYLMYAIAEHQGEYIIFATKQLKYDEGYRIFYAHADHVDGQDDGELNTHLWCLDAKRLPYHEHE